MYSLKVMKLIVPWRKYTHWACLQCGKCCDKRVKLREEEVKNFDLDTIEIIDSMVGVNRYKTYYIKKDVSKKCPFLIDNKCSVDSTKPYECRMYPFEISRLPLAKTDGSQFEYNNKIYYIYISPECSGFGHGIKIETTIEKIIDLWKNTEKKDSLITLKKRK